MLAAVERTLYRLARVLAVVGLCGLLLLAVMTLLDGLLRSLFNHPIDAVRDLGGVVAAMSVACCLPVALLERSNITIRFLGGLVGRAAGNVADRMAGVVVLIVIAAMARQFLLFARSAAQNGDATWILNIGTAPFWYSVDAMMWIAVLCQLVAVLRLMQGAAPLAVEHNVH